jgi:uncharacterized iron-regulated protein
LGPIWTWHFLGALLTLAITSGCASTARVAHPPIHPGRHHAPPERTHRPVGETLALDLSTTSNLENLIPRLADMRVVLVGETHDRFDHHLIQLEIVRGLHAVHPKLAIGMEAFQQPFQRRLDDYVAGELSERELLRETEYYRRWGFDFRLYEPILRYAREQRLPLIALNLPVELTRKVGQRGIDGLSDEERAGIPEEIDRSDSAYQSRLEEIFAEHPRAGGQSFERFLEVQLLWDEGMAERAAEYLESHPEHAMVILAGSGHLAYGSGIPRRLVRRIPVRTAVVINDWEGELGPEIADFVLFPQRRDLPAAGRIGALLDEDPGGLEILTCTSGSACERAGLESGDRIVSIDDEPVTDMADLRLVMWDKRPGDRVTMEILRERRLFGSRQLTREVALQ